MHVVYILDSIVSIEIFEIHLPIVKSQEILKTKDYYM